MKSILLCFVLLSLSGFGPKAIADELLKPTNLEKLNTEADEDDAHVTANGLILYYASNASKNFHIMVSERKTRGQPWSKGKLVDELKSESDDRSPYLYTAKDQTFLYFATKKLPKDLDDKNAKGNFDIYWAVRNPGKNSAFSAPTPIHVVATDDDELHPWVTAKGEQLFFSRKTKDGWRVGVAFRPGGYGQWENAKLVELPAGFHHPTLTSNGLVMYLQGPLENNRSGLFVTRRANFKAAWSKPEPLTGLNHPDGSMGDMSPCLSSDGNFLYFSSDRPGGKGGIDIWMISTGQLNRKGK